MHQLILGHLVNLLNEKKKPEIQCVKTIKSASSDFCWHYKPLGPAQTLENQWIFVKIFKKNKQFIKGFQQIILPTKFPRLNGNIPKGSHVFSILSDIKLPKPYVVEVSEIPG